MSNNFELDPYDVLNDDEDLEDLYRGNNKRWHSNNARREIERRIEIKRLRKIIGEDDIDDDA